MHMFHVTIKAIAIDRSIPSVFNSHSQDKEKITYQWISIIGKFAPTKN